MSRHAPSRPRPRWRDGFCYGATDPREANRREIARSGGLWLAGLGGSVILWAILRVSLSPATDWSLPNMLFVGGVTMALMFAWDAGRRRRILWERFIHRDCRFCAHHVPNWEQNAHCPACDYDNSLFFLDPAIFRPPCRTETPDAPVPLYCRRCRHTLVGLPNHTCPECGFDNAHFFTSRKPRLSESSSEASGIPQTPRERESSSEASAQ